MDGKGRQGTYNFSHDDWGRAAAEGQGIGTQGAAAPYLATPLAPPTVNKHPKLCFRSIV